MTIEVMKQALEALENAQHFIDEYAAAKYIHFHNAAFTSLRQAIAEAEKQEPVAYSKEQMQIYAELNYEAGYTTGYMDGSIKTREAYLQKQEPVAIDDGFDEHFKSRIDVYADQHPALLVRQLAIRLRQAWNTHPQPKREWVGLTTLEADEISRRFSENFDYTINDCVRAIEAKLKEKNT